VCHAGINPKDIPMSKFDCIGCGTTLRRDLPRGYTKWQVRVCYAAATIYAWTHGWNDLSIVFVVSFYAFPAIIVWELLVPRFFPPKKIERATDTQFICTLGNLNYPE
jgi:hypothetical protein